VAKCDGCGADIVWAETPSGAKQPFNREPDAKGNRVLLGRGPDKPPLALSRAAVDVGRIYDEGGIYYVPHHATCPEVESFR
jgi:hypothetical protein